MTGHRKLPGDTSCGYDWAARIKITKGTRAAMRRAALENTGSAYTTGHIAEEPIRPVTLPRVKWLERPELESTPREILGAKTPKDAPSSSEYLRNLNAMRAAKEDPHSTAGIAGMLSKGSGPAVPNATPAELDEGAIIFEGEVAWQRLRSSHTLTDWLAVGRALLVLRRQSVELAGAYKGIKYSKQNALLVDQHGFKEVSKSARQTAMLVAENWNEIEPWLNSFEPDRRLNHPMVIWRGWKQSQRKHDDDAEVPHDEELSTWRNRQRLNDPSLFTKVEEAVRPLLADQDEKTIKEVCCAAIRAMGFAVPTTVYRSQAGHA